MPLDSASALRTIVRYGQRDWLSAEQRLADMLRVANQALSESALPEAMSAPTPRTDALKEQDWRIIFEHACQLERELNAAVPVKASPLGGDGNGGEIRPATQVSAAPNEALALGETSFTQKVRGSAAFIRACYSDGLSEKEAEVIATKLDESADRIAGLEASLDSAHDLIADVQRQLSALKAQRPEGLPPIPESIVRRIIRECEDAEHPKGMSVHDGRTRIHSSDVRMLLKRLERAEGRQYMNDSPKEKK